MYRWNHKIWFKIVSWSLIVTIFYLTSDIWRLPVLSGSVAYAQTPSKSIHNQGKQIESTLEKIEASTSNPETLLQELSSQIDLLKAKDAEFRLDLKKTEEKIATLSPTINARHTEFVQNYDRQITELLTELDAIPLIQDQGLLSEKVESSLTKLKDFTKKKTKVLHTDTLSHRSLSDTVVSPGVITTPILPPGITNPTPQPEDLTSTPETELTPDIKRYAEQFSFNPVQIYEFVRNTIDYEPYFGGVKTATQVLLDRKGNDIDTASLLIALLRASKIPCRYVYGKADLPIERAASWVGTTDPTLTVGNFTKNGIPATATTGGGTYSQVTIDHVWVRAYVNYIPSRGREKGEGDTWIDIDPSFKEHVWKEGKDVGVEIGVDPTTFLSDIKRQSQINETESYATGEPQDFIIQKVQDWGKDVQNYASANSLSIENLYRKKEINDEKFGILPARLSYVSTPQSIYSILPDELKHHFKLTLLSTDGVTPVIQHKVSLPELSTKNLTLSYLPKDQDDIDALNLYANEPIIPCYIIRLLPELRIDGEEVIRLLNTPITMGWNQELQLEFITPTTGTDKVINTLTAGSYTGITLNLIDISERTLYKRLANLRFIQEKISKNDTSLTLNDLIGEVLSTIGISYFYQLDRLNQGTAGSLNVHATRQPSEASTTYDLSVTTLFGVPYTASASLITLDVDRDIITPISATGDAIKEKQFLAGTGLTASALEHAILEEVLSGDAVSTVRAIESANASNIPAYKVTRDNLETVLSSLSQEVRDIAETDIRNAINAGRIVTIPKDPITYAGWQGTGYIILDPDTNAGSYILSGDISGGIRPSTFLTPSSLIIPTNLANYGSFSSPAVSWLNVAEDWTEDIAWAYIPAITSINEWFKDARTLDLATTIASTIAISGPISKISSSITIFDAVAGPGLFSPNNDGMLDTTTISANLTKSCNWTLTISTSPLVGEGGGEGAIATWTGIGSSISIVWDGSDSLGNTLPSGEYIYTVTASDPVKGTVATPVSGKVTIDTIAPLAELTSPSEGSSLTGAVFIQGSCSDEHFESYKLEYGTNTSYTKIFSSITPITGAITTWDTRTIPSGSYILRLTVKDKAGNTTTVTRNITLSNDTQAPIVTITSPPANATVTGSVTISASAQDDTAVTKIELYIGTTLVSTSTVSPITYSWDTTTITNGTYTLTVKAYDAADNIGTGQVQVTVSNAISNLQASPNPFSPNADGYQDSTTISAILASIGPWTLEIHNPQSQIVKSFSGTGTVISQVWDGKDSQGSVVPDGTYTATITADTATATINLYVQVVNIPPTANITTPTANQQVTGFVDIIGTASDVVPIDFASWTLTYEPFGGSSTQIATGTTPVTNATLATWDTTQLQNGVYTLTLTAQDKAGEITESSVQVQLIGELKVGNFRFTQQDIVIPVQGLPITVSRTYDTLTKDRYKELGHGWTLDISDINLETDDYYDNFESISGGYLPLRISGGRDVTITLPDGRRTVYSFSLEPVPGESFTYRAVWKAPSGVYDTLKMNGSDRVYFLYGGLTYWAQGTQDQGYEYFDIPGYTLTTPDGTRYIIEKEDLGGDYVDIGGGEFVWSQNLGKERLTQIIDQNGNALTFRPEGITHSTGKGITFNRDSQGRITSIIDPAGDVAVEYGYDVTGDLTIVTQLVDKTTTPPKKVTTTFTYSTHRLTDIQDPRGPGFKPVRNYYYDDGRLWKTVDGFDREVVFQHSISARQEVVTDRLGNPTIYEYNNDGLVVAVTDALGNTTTYEYDTNKNKISETNPLGQTTRYTYDSKGNLLTTTDPLGNTTTYTYNALGQVITTTDPLGHVTTNEYDSKGNRTKTIDTLGNTTTYEYDLSGNMLASTDAQGTRTENTYNQYGWLTQQKVAVPFMALITEYTYDDLGNQITSTTYRTVNGIEEAITSTNVYDKQNRLTKTIDALGNYTETTYNEIGKQISTRDKNGNITQYEYDIMGQLKKVVYPDTTYEEYTYDWNGNRLTTKDRSGHITTYQYDNLNRVVRTTYPDNSFTMNEYDTVGRLTAVTDANNNVTQYEYDSAGRRTKVIQPSVAVPFMALITEYTYDAAGNQTSFTDANGNTTEYKYDALNRQVRLIYADSTQSTTEYDALGRKVMSSDQAQVSTNYSYDRLGRLTSVILPSVAVPFMALITEYAYDELGNRLTQTDANNHTTSFEYDKLGRLTKKTQPSTLVSEGYTYDPNGNTILKTDFNGQKTRFAYDSNNRLTSKDYGDDGTLDVEFTYTPTGQRASMTDSHGTTAYQYDNRDRLIKVTHPDGKVQEYGYDAQGNQTSSVVKDTLGTVIQSITKTYDTLNRLKTIIEQEVAVPFMALITEYTYDAIGNRKSVTSPNGTIAEYTNNSLNRLTNLVNKKTTGEIISSHIYTLGPTGNRLAVIEVDGSRIDYGYDNLYRLTSETRTGANAYTISYTYDKVGNRLSQTKDGAVTTYTYNANDQLLTETTAGVTTTYNYDNNGNTISKTSPTETVTYSYDYENRLITATTPTGVTSYAYDGDGNRISKTTSVNSALSTVSYLVDTNNNTGFAQVVAEFDSSGNLVTSYLYGDDLISQDRSGSISYYHYDGLGSTRALTDSTATITDTYSYYAFGELLAKTGTTPNDYLFAGEQYDPNVGFYYLRARYYNPSVGRFVTVDPWQGSIYDPQSLHKYLYANLNPINNIDPSGRFTLSELLLTSVIIFLLITNLVSVIKVRRESELNLTIAQLLQEINNMFIRRIGKQMAKMLLTPTALQPIVSDLTKADNILSWFRFIKFGMNIISQTESKWYLESLDAYADESTRDEVDLILMGQVYPQVTGIPLGMKFEQLNRQQLVDLGSVVDTFIKGRVVLREAFNQVGRLVFRGIMLVY